MKNSKFDIPTSLIILGVTGDLTRRKLIPSLFDMFRKGYLPTIFRVIGFSRDAYTDEEFRIYAKGVIVENGREYTEDELNDFLKVCFYEQGTFENNASYEKISRRLMTIDDSVGVCMNKLFYLAVPPIFYETIFKNLSDSGLTIPCDQDRGWTRVLVEKPFGKDLETAQKLDTLLGTLFKEQQIFRIDHYLAKETLQNILSFRFSNTIFEPIWNNQWIEKVEIKLWEDIDVATRGAFYDDIGALRDVGQNHLLQMLSLIAMNHPGKFQAESVRAERADIIKRLHVSGEVVRGQYEGYTKTAGVSADSKTETYFRLKTFIENDRWKGVPFYLESGKALADKKVEIVVTFKEMHPCFCSIPHDLNAHQNTITFTIQPQEKITIRFWAKQPGMYANVVPQDLSFDYLEGSGDILRADAYEKVLFDCIVGDQTLFASTEELKASWAFITPILRKWKDATLEIYQKKSTGPKK